MGSAVTKTEIYKQMEADVKELQLGAANIQKIQDSVSGIQTKATDSLKSFTEVKDGVTGKIDETTKKVTDMGNVQNDLKGKIGKFEGALKKAASSALTGGMMDAGKKALGGFF
jgi:hypothetical protein